MKKSGILMIIGSALLLGLFIFPLWNIELGAPQYPDPLAMNIYIDGIEGEEEFDIQNIDGVNKYIGMKKIPKPEEMWEFRVFPAGYRWNGRPGNFIGFAWILREDEPTLVFGLVPFNGNSWNAWNVRL